MNQLVAQQAGVGGIAAVALAIGAFLALTELIARIAIRSGGYFVFQPGQKERLHLDRVSHPQLEPTVHRFINEFGERGGPLPRRGRVYRILVVGGSVAESFTQDQDTQWPAVLEQRLQSPEALAQLKADAVHVGNIGRSGVDSRSLDTLLRLAFPRYPRLDLIVVIVGASDVLRWLEAGAPPSRPAEELPVHALFARHPDLEFGWSLKQWGLAEWVRRWRARRLVERANVASWMGRARRDRAHAKRILDEIPSHEIVLDNYRTHLRSALRRSALHADRVLLVGQPWFEKSAYTPEEEALFWNGAVGQAYKGTVTEFYSSRVICRLMRELDEVAAALALEEGVEYLALQGRILPSVANFIDHFHSTLAGSRQIGEVVAEAVLRAPPTSQRPS